MGGTPIFEVWDSPPTLSLPHKGGGDAAARSVSSSGVGAAGDRLIPTLRRDDPLAGNGQVAHAHVEGVVDRVGDGAGDGAVRGFTGAIGGKGSSMVRTAEKSVGLVAKLTFCEIVYGTCCPIMFDAEGCSG